MSVISGVISRQLLPACESLCFFCPSLRTRSRQPVKRYKKMIATIFQDEEPNDRMIGKLCEYAAKNPLRIPKITDTLEQRCYKEIRMENFNTAKIVLCVYRKLLITCKEQMPLFANSLLSIMNTLLDQTRHDEIRVLGCQTLFIFVNNQIDGTYMFNIEVFIPKLVHLAQEVGEDERAISLRASSLQALSSMVWLMGQHPHISEEFDSVVSVVLENYVAQKQEIKEVQGTVSQVNPSKPDALARTPSWREIVNEKGEINVTQEEVKDPGFWSRVCLHNMAKLGKEATTTRRVLECLFRYFDTGNLWSSKHGLAFPVLKDLQTVMEDSGDNAHFLLSVLVKHLDHKNVLKKPDMQLDIIEVSTSITKHSTVGPSVSILGAVRDVMRHLRKSIHCSLDDANLGMEVINWNRKFRDLIDECLVELSHKVGDAGPILDLMAVMLENISSITVISRTTIAAVYRTAQIVASLPNTSYQNKAFPEALFHQLLPAMVHPDLETRVGAHRIFAVVLVPTSVAPRERTTVTVAKKDLPRMLSRSVSVFSSSAALFEKMKKERAANGDSIIQESSVNAGPNTMKSSYNTGNNSGGVINRLKSSYSRAYSMKNPNLVEEVPSNNLNKEGDVRFLKLSTRQITLLLSSFWAQSISPENKPENYEAIAHTYSLVMLFSRAKNSSTEVLIQSFQLAFSLRSIALGEGGLLPPSRHRSLFTLATAMIIFASKAYNVTPLIASAKATLQTKSKLVDPFLFMVGDTKLQAAKSSTIAFGSKEDDASSARYITDIQITVDQTRESYVTVILKCLENISESELTIIKEQLFNEFIPDDVCPLGTPMSPSVIYQFSESKNTFEEKPVSFFTTDDDVLPDSSNASSQGESQSPIDDLHLISVNQILDSVLDASQQVGRFSVSTAPDVPYKEMANHCEELSIGKQRKMSHLIAAQRQESMIGFPRADYNLEGTADPTISSRAGNPFLDGNPVTIPNGHQLPPLPLCVAPLQCSAELQNESQGFRLPALSPYDNFLRAAGC